jgi:GAF domain-containing protein
MAREDLLARSFVELADTLVDEFDVVDLLTTLTDRCVEVLGASAAGIMLASPEGELAVAASSSEAMRVLEVFELQCEEGPCLDAFSTDEAVTVDDLTTADDRWPRFSPACRNAGFASVHAVPLHLRGTTIGALNLFSIWPGSMGKADLLIAQAFADVATIAILQLRMAEDSQALIGQLRHALDGRVLIEQAKGLVAARANIEVEQAFELLRRYSRDNNLLLVNVAEGVVDGSIATSALRQTPKGR